MCAGPSTRKPKLRIRNPKPGTRNPKSGIWNPDPGTRNPKPGNLNPKLWSRGTRLPRKCQCRRSISRTSPLFYLVCLLVSVLRLLLIDLTMLWISLLLTTVLLSVSISKVMVFSLLLLLLLLLFILLLLLLLLLWKPLLCYNSLILISYLEQVMKSRNTTSKEVSMQEELLAHLTTVCLRILVYLVIYDSG